MAAGLRPAEHILLDTIETVVVKLGARLPARFGVEVSATICAARIVILPI